MSKSAKAATALAVLVLALGAAAPAFADSCERSHDYIVEGLAGDLPKPGKLYDELFKICQQVLDLPNVKDAYVIKAGTIAIDPTRNTVMATSTTLSEFCQRFPTSSVRFLTPTEQRQARTVGLVVMLPAGAGVTLCTAVGGGT